MGFWGGGWRGWRGWRVVCDGCVRFVCEREGGGMEVGWGDGIYIVDDGTGTVFFWFWKLHV